ncbi:MAG: YugE family protein [Lachnospiraceae bacterium]|nr:YugE family protein [Lachnospiraceae bacterium]
MKGKIGMYFIKNIIDNWDPIDLFPGAPDDEYWTENEEIEKLLEFTDSPIKLSEGIYEVFVKSFGEDTFKKSKSECERIAQMILSQEGR